MSGLLTRLTPSNELVAKVLSGAGIVFGIRVTSAALAFVSIAALARWMGAAEYGVFAYAYSWLFLLALPAGLGLSAVCVRFLAEYVALDDWAKVRGLIGRSAALTLMTGIAIALIAATGIWLAPNLIRPQYRIPLLIAVFGVPLIALATLGSQVGRAFGWVAWAYGPSQIWQPVALLIVAGAMATAGATMNARVMIPVSLIIGGLTLIVQAMVYARRLRPQLRNVPAAYHQRAWLRVAVPLLVIDSFAALIMHADIVMVGIFLTPEDVAHYFAATRVAMVASFFLASVGALAGPNLAALHAQGKTRDMQELLAGVTPWITVPALTVTLLLVVAGWQLLRLFGPGFEAGYVALLLLAAGHLVASANGPAALILNMTGHQDWAGLTYGGAALTNIALNALLIPRFGIAGAALATALTTIGMSATLVTLVRRRLGLRSSIFGTLRT
jgi:O-antigen/teichoic acid export membrane protein